MTRVWKLFHTNLVEQMLFGRFSDALVAGAQRSEVLRRLGTYVIVQLEHDASDGQRVDGNIEVAAIPISASSSHDSKKIKSINVFVAFRGGLG